MSNIKCSHCNNMKLHKKLSKQSKQKESAKDNDLKTDVRHLGVVLEHIDDKLNSIIESNKR